MIAISNAISIGLNKVGGGSTPGYDPDAQAFFSRVETAGGTLTNTEKTATNQLVLSMKAYGIWTSMKAIYPMVGSSAAACAQNLKSASFTGTFTSGWTFASTGATPNGTSAFFDTGIVPNAQLSLNSAHISMYCRTNTQNSSYDFNAGLLMEIVPKWTDSKSYYCINGNEVSAGTQTSTFGLFIATRTNSNTKLFYNSSLQNSNTQSPSSLPNVSIIYGCQNVIPKSYFTNRQTAFLSVGDGLTDTEASNFYTAVQAFQTTLGRQVGAQIVSDADAQAYINRVYTAGGTLTNTEANAVNQLVIDMKASNVWTAMKAVYPMVGSSAAACAQNLKSSSFTGSFSSGWTFASTGVTPNGISAYFNTNFVPSAQLNTTDLVHLSYYSRTDSAVLNEYAMGSASITSNLSLILRRNTNLRFFAADFPSGTTYRVALDTNSTNGTGFFVGTQQGANIKLFRNNSLAISNTSVTLSNSIPTFAIGIAAINDNGTFSNFTNKQTVFNSIGNSLTDTQASNLYTCVQTFQTTLGRQV